MDADLQHLPALLPQIVEALKTNEMVVASHYAPGGSPGEWTLRRKVVSAVANLLSLPLLPGAKDRMSGFFALSRIGTVRFGW